MANWWDEFKVAPGQTSASSMLDPTAASANWWDEFAVKPEPTAPAEGDRPGAMRTLGRGVDQMQGNLYGAVEAAGEAVGSSTLTDFGKTGREANVVEAGAGPAGQDMWDIRGLGDAFAFAKEAILQNAPQMGLSVAGGAAGAAAGSFVMPGVGTVIGGVLGAFIPNYAMGVGEVQGAIKDKDPNAVAPGYAFVGGTAVAALDSILPAKFGGMLTQRFGKEIADVAAKEILKTAIPKEIAKEMGTEAITEGIQSAISEASAAAATGQQLDPDWWRNAIAEGVAGAIVGGTAGGVTHAATRKRTPAPEEEPALANPSLLDQTPAAPSRLTEADNASPIANDLIDEGKGLMDDLLSGRPISPVEAARTNQVAPEIRATLLAANETDDTIDAMGPEEIARSMELASRSGITPTPQQISAAATYSRSENTQADIDASDRAILRKVGMSDGGIDRLGFSGAADTARGVVSAENVKASPEEISAASTYGKAQPKIPDPVQTNPRQPDPIQPAQQQAAPVLPSALDTAANASATSPSNATPEPTQAQKDAGNYKLGHHSIGGMKVSIENPQGSSRSGTDSSGKAWSVEMKSHYGYFKGTLGKDKDHIDTFIKPGTDNWADEAPVFVVDQIDPKTGKLDEHKVMVGYASRGDAQQAYNENYSKGWDGLGAITQTTMGEFRAWAMSPGQKTMPFGRLPVRAQKLRKRGSPIAPGVNPATLENAKPAAEVAPQQPAAPSPVAATPEPVKAPDAAPVAPKVSKKPKARTNAAGIPVTARGAIKKPVSLIEFLAQRGGVKDQGSELSALGLKGAAGFVSQAGPLIRKTGMSLDEARRIAVEEGYITDSGANTTTQTGEDLGQSQSYVSDLLDALAHDNRSARQGFSVKDGAHEAAWREQQDQEGNDAQEQSILDRNLDEIVALTLLDRNSAFAQDMARMMGDGEMTVDEASERSAFMQADDAEVDDQTVAAYDEIPFFDEEPNEVQSSTAPEDGAARREGNPAGQAAPEGEAAGNSETVPRRSSPGTEGGSPAVSQRPEPVARPVASWVIKNKATGEIIMETFDRKKVDALNTEKYEAVPIGEHLASLNKPATQAATTVEPGADNKPQTVIPGAERVPDKNMAEIKANEPKRATKPQQEPGGMFDEANTAPQLFDAPAAKPKAPQSVPDMRAKLLDTAYSINPAAVLADKRGWRVKKEGDGYIAMRMSGGAGQVNSYYRSPSATAWTLEEAADAAMSESHTVEAKPGDDGNVALFALAQKAETPAFKKWFGASKIVDKAGDPAVVYHGTGREFDAFSMAKSDDAEGRSKMLGLGGGKIYLTGARAIADIWASSAPSRGKGGSQRVISAYASVSKPMLDTEYSRRYLAMTGFSIGDSRQSQADRDSAIAALDDELKAEGYDGIIDELPTGKHGMGQLAVFSPAQIKSVDNNGDFDPADDRMSFARGAGQPSTSAAFSLTEKTGSVTTRFELTEAFVEKAAEVGASIRKELNRLGLKDIELRVSERISAIVNGETWDADGRFFKGILDVSLTAENPAAVVSHEAIHAMKSLGVFSDAEWAILERKSESTWASQYDIAGRYGPWSAAKQREEGIAHAYADWATGTKTDGMIAKIFRKVSGVIEAVGNAMRGLGFNTADSIFADVTAGKVGSRSRGSTASGGEMFMGNNQKDGDAFKTWFGGSKVVDDAGNPMVVYHGTDETFSKFKTKGEGAFFTTNENIAQDYGDVLEVYLNIKNPYVVTAEQWNLGEGLSPEEARAEGHDGYQITDHAAHAEDDVEMDDTGDTWLAFEPGQIKSATGKNGDFSSEQDSINFALPQTVAAARAATGTAMTDLVRVLKSRSSKDQKTAEDGETMGDYMHRKFIDRLHPVSELVERIGGTVRDMANPYLQARLSDDRTRRKVVETYDKFMRPMMEEIARYRIEMKELHEFLYALHAEERNVVVGRRNPPTTQFYKAIADPRLVGASGMSTENARAILSRVRNDPAKAGPLGRAADMMRRMLDENLADQLASGLIDQQLYDMLTQQWRNYVPLKNDDGMDPEGFWLAASGKGFDVRGKEFEAAVGSYSETDNVILNGAQQAVRSMVRQGKNEVGKSLLRFVNQHDPQGLNIAEVYWSDAPQLGNIVKATVLKQRTLDSNGKVVWKTKPNPFTSSDDAIATKVGGKVYYLKFQDRKIGAALKSLDKQPLNAVLSVMGTVSNLQSLVNTRMNPAFTPINIIRDVWTGHGTMAAFGFTKSEANKAVRNVPAAMGAMWRSIQHKRGTTPEQQRWDAVVDDFLADGGYTSFDNYADLTKDVKALEKEMARTAKAVHGSTGWARVPAAGRKFIELIQKLNDAGENGFRIAVYAAAIEKGITRDKAAFMGRDVTVDFKKKGELGTEMNAAYVFFNSSLEGNYNLAKRMGTSKAVRRTAAKFIMAGFAVSLINSMTAGDDDDGENYYAKMLKNEPWKLERNLVIFIPGTKGKYVMVPLPFGFNAFNNVGVQGYAVATGAKSPLEAISSIIRVYWESFNPMGSGSLISMLTPTIADPLIDLGFNENFAGNPIHPSENTFDQAPPPKSSQAFKSTHPAFKWIAEGANSLTGGDEVQAGWGDTYPDNLEYLWGFITGGVGRFVSQTGETLVRAGDNEFDPGKTPYVRSFYGQPSPDRMRGQYFGIRQDVQEAKAQLADYRSSGDMETANRYRQERALDLSLVGLVGGVENQRRSMNKQRRMLEKQRPSDLEAKLKAIDEREAEAMLRVRKAYIEKALGE